MDYMQIKRLYVLSKIFLQQLMCNQRVFHFPTMYQKLISMYFGDYSTVDKIADHHPSLVDGFKLLANCKTITTLRNFYLWKLYLL